MVSMESRGLVMMRLWAQYTKRIKHPATHMYTGAAIAQYLKCNSYDVLSQNQDIY